MLGALTSLFRDVNVPYKVRKVRDVMVWDVGTLTYLIRYVNVLKKTKKKTLITYQKPTYL